VLTITSDQIRRFDAAAPRHVRLDAVLDHLGRAHPEVLDGLSVAEARALTQQYVAAAEAIGLGRTPAIAAYAALCFAFDEHWPRRTRIGQFLPKPDDEGFLAFLANPADAFVQRLEEAYPTVADLDEAA